MSIVTYTHHVRPHVNFRFGKKIHSLLYLSLSLFLCACVHVWTRKPVEGSDHCFKQTNEQKKKKKKRGNWKADAIQTFGLGPALS